MNQQDNTLALIIEHGITVRQIPRVVVSNWSFLPNQQPKDENERFVKVGSRVYLEKTSYPSNGGMWMAKACTSTSAGVRWSMNEDCLSETLQEAVQKAVDKHLALKEHRKANTEYL
nr:hypothetical protein [Vibrio splendidus]MCC4881873.1 hypothetical protein [Vibrio splendidus]